MRKNLLVTLIILLLSLVNLQANDLYILFTANINGTLQNCDCGTEPLGGIGRIKTYFNEFRSQHQNCIAIDGGDFFNSYPYPSLDSAMFQALKIMNYDVFVPGEQEFVEGEELFHKIMLSLKSKVLISNLEDCSHRERKIKYEKFNMYLYGYLSPQSFTYIKNDNTLSLLKFSSLSIKPERKGLNVVVFHGNLSEALTVAEKNRWIDLILLAHDQQENQWEVDNTLIVGAGKDSESITKISVIKRREDWDFSIERIKIKESIVENKEILDLINHFNNEEKKNNRTKNIKTNKVN